MSRMASITVSLPLPSVEEEAVSISQLPRIMGELIITLRQEAVAPVPPPVFWLSHESGQCKLNAKGQAPMDGDPAEGDEEAWDALLG